MDKKGQGSQERLQELTNLRRETIIRKSERRFKARAKLKERQAVVPLSSSDTEVIR